MVKKFMILVTLLSTLVCVGLFLIAPFEPSIALRRSVAVYLYHREYDVLARIVWRSLSTNGDAISRNNLAAMDYRDFYLPDNHQENLEYENFEKADREFLRAAEQNHVAEYNRAMIRVYGGPDSKWFQSAIEHLKLAARLGNENAREVLASYESDPDPQSAFFKALADQGDPFAAARYEDPFTKNDDINVQLKYLRMASQGGERTAMADLGRALFDEFLMTGEPRELATNPLIVEATYWTLQAAELGERSAAHDIGSCYRLFTDGCAYWTDAQAVEWYRLSIEAEQRMAPPRVRMDEQGTLVLNVSHFSAMNAFVQQFYGSNLANLGLGDSYLFGRGVKMDLDKAKEYYSKIEMKFPRDNHPSLQKFERRENEIKALADAYFPTGYVRPEVDDHTPILNHSFGFTAPISVLHFLDWKEKFPADALRKLEPVVGRPRYVVKGSRFDPVKIKLVPGADFVFEQEGLLVEQDGSKVSITDLKTGQTIPQPL